MTELQRLRFSSGLSQLEAAAKMSVTARALRAWETGERAPKLHQYRKIARVYRIALTDVHAVVEATLAQGSRGDPSDDDDVPAVAPAPRPRLLLLRVRRPLATLV